MLQQQAANQAQENPEKKGGDPSFESTIVGDNEALFDQFTPGMYANPIRILESQPTASSVSFQVNTDRLLDIYYENFWPAVPVTLPLHYLTLRRLDGNHCMENVILVLQWIGSIYAPWTPSEPYYTAACQALKKSEFPRNPWSVQALMLLSIAEYHWDLRPESRKTADTAIELALELQMNSKEFAQAYGEGNPVLEESWRRTYYFLPLLDQHLAVVVNSPFFTLRDVPNHVDLPCDDEYYETGVSSNISC